jgi:hypothetical protein
MAHSPTVQSPSTSPLLLATLETQASTQLDIFRRTFLLPAPRTWRRLARSYAFSLIRLLRTGYVTVTV